MIDTSTTKFKYDKGFAYIAGTILFLLFTCLVYRTFTIKELDNKKILICFDIGLLMMLSYFIKRFFIPAIKGRTALELNKEGIVDIVNNRVVTWGNVENIREVSFKYSSGIAIDLFDKTGLNNNQNFIQKIICAISNYSYNTPVIIPFQYISGDNSEILLTIKDYFATKKLSPT